jgi:hypothetical protein
LRSFTSTLATDFCAAAIVLAGGLAEAAVARAGLGEGEGEGEGEGIGEAAGTNGSCRAVTWPPGPITSTGAA